MIISADDRFLLCTCGHSVRIHDLGTGRRLHALRKLPHEIVFWKLLRKVGHLLMVDKFGNVRVTHYLTKKLIFASSLEFRLNRVFYLSKNQKSLFLEKSTTGYFSPKRMVERIQINGLRKPRLLLTKSSKWDHSLGIAPNYENTRVVVSSKKGLLFLNTSSGRIISRSKVGDRQWHRAALLVIRAKVLVVKVCKQVLFLRLDTCETVLKLQIETSNSSLIALPKDSRLVFGSNKNEKLQIRDISFLKANSTKFVGTQTQQKPIFLQEIRKQKETLLKRSFFKNLEAKSDESKPKNKDWLKASRLSSLDQGSHSENPIYDSAIDDKPNNPRLKDPKPKNTRIDLLQKPDGNKLLSFDDSFKISFFERKKLLQNLDNIEYINDNQEKIKKIKKNLKNLIKTKRSVKKPHKKICEKIKIFEIENRHLRKDIFKLENEYLELISKINKISKLFNKNE